MNDEIPDAEIDARIREREMSAGQSVYRWYFANMPDGSIGKYPNREQAREAIRRALKDQD